MVFPTPNLGQASPGALENPCQVLNLRDFYGVACSKERAASSGREPCILLEADDSSLSMVADWNDLQLAAGDVASFERILLAKLLMY